MIKNVLNLKNVEPGVLDVSEANFGYQGIEKGLLSTSWSVTDGITANQDEVLFTLVFNTLRSGNTKDLFNINSKITKRRSI